LGAVGVHDVGTALLVSVSIIICGGFDSELNNTLQGGSFLYVATVLQPVSDTHMSFEDGIGHKMRTLLLMVGMFVPFLVGNLLGHGH
jgi:hypothetical protein